MIDFFKQIPLKLKIKNILHIYLYELELLTPISLC
jgi:hypothetical protein